MKPAVLAMDISSCKCFAIFLFIIYNTLTPFPFSAAVETINPSQNLTNGQTLVSPGGVFELGFFTPGNTSTFWYLGMWYRNLPVRTYVWVANRDSPMISPTGVVLRVTEPGILVLMNSTNDIIWSTNTSRSVQNPVAQLLESGNFVVRDSSDNMSANPLWQMFDHPTDTYLPGMRFGWNLVTGVETRFVSWRSDDDPAPGNYTWLLDRTGYPQMLLKYGPGRNDIVYRFGPWNGIRISALPDSPAYRTFFVLNASEAYYRSEPIDPSLGQGNGIRIRYFEVQRLTWVDTRGWVPYLTNPADSCDTFMVCAGNEICDVRNSPSCGCLDKFVPRNRSDRLSGCQRRTNLSCEGDAFVRYTSIKLPDTRNAWYNMNMTEDQCRDECSRNCSCIAYTQLDLSRRIGCLFWYGDLIDVKHLTTAYGQDIYIRVAASEADEPGGRKRRILIASLTSVFGFVLICLCLFLCLRMRKKDTTTRNNDSMMVKKEGLYSENKQRDSELPWFDLSLILKATDNFSDKNKLGEGGFGPVYKGTLERGEEIAVKRLSKDSVQGLDELKNEVKLIAKLQHRNLVRLIGCCIQGEDNLLVYEYMPNRSLDGILFDKIKGKKLDWATRFKIINGIARGLMYLHQDSRLRVIHRDLKASNILLDKDMTPKISDFGLARSFGDELEANTRRVIGTYGYMSPEYAVDGMFSVKSDVYSFGVLLLEIVTGKRNRGFSHNEHKHNLIGHAWLLYKEGRFLELIDANLGNFFSLSEVRKSIQVGLLCVQKHSEDRPNMSSVVFMLENDVDLPQAKEPGFFSERAFASDDTTSTITKTASGANEMTISIVEPR